VAERSTVAGVLEQQLNRNIPSLHTGRACAVLALMHGDPDLAPAFSLRMASWPGSTAAELQRLSAFQTALAEQFPEYRPVELPTVAG
jgi:hypothetical protein